MRRLLDWLTGRDLDAAFGAQEPAGAQEGDGAPLIPDHEPRKPVSTSERKSRGLRTRIQREEIENALDRMVYRATRNWAESTPAETAKREELYRYVGTIRALREELRNVEADGEMAAAEERAEAKRQAMRPADNR